MSSAFYIFTFAILKEEEKWNTLIQIGHLSQFVHATNIVKFTRNLQRSQQHKMDSLSKQHDMLFYLHADLV